VWPLRYGRRKSLGVLSLKPSVGLGLLRTDPGLARSPSFDLDCDRDGSRRMPLLAAFEINGGQAARPISTG
jgi:hypothetical protein